MKASRAASPHSVESVAVTAQLGFTYPEVLGSLFIFPPSRVKEVAA